MNQTQRPQMAPPARRASILADQMQHPETQRFWIAAGLWVAAILAFAAYFYHKFYPGALTNADAMDFAQIARNMVSGHGYATSILRPLAVSGVAGPDASGTAPDVSRAPLYPLLLTLAFLVHGKHGGDNSVINVSFLLFLISIYAVYRLARTLFPGPQQVWIALLSMGLYAFSGDALSNAVSGLPVTLATIFVTALVIALYRASDTPQRPATFASAVWVGVLLALCYLTQYSLLLLVLPIGFYLYFDRTSGRGWPAVGGCLLGFVLVAGPWLYRNAVVCHGNPFFTLLFYGIMADSPQYPGFSTIYRSVLPQTGLFEYSFAHLPDVLARLTRGLSFYRDHALDCFGFVLLPGAVVSLFWHAPDARLNGLRACAATSLLLVVLVTAAFQPSAEMIAPFGPLITVIAVGFLVTLIGLQAWELMLQRTAIWALGVVVALGGFLQAYTQTPPPADLIPQGMTLLSNMGLAPKNAIITESAAEVAWRLDRPAIWLPVDNSAYHAVADTCAREKIHIAALLLTPQIVRFDLRDGEAMPWAMLLRNPTAGADHAKADAQWQQFPQLAAEHKASVPALLKSLTPTQYADDVRTRIDAQYDMDYGPISDMVDAFTPAVSQPESENQYSVLFRSRSR